MKPVDARAARWNELEVRADNASYGLEQGLSKLSRAEQAPPQEILARALANIPKSSHRTAAYTEIRTLVADLQQVYDDWSKLDGVGTTAVRAVLELCNELGSRGLASAMPVPVPLESLPPAVAALVRNHSTPENQALQAEKAYVFVHSPLYSVESAPEFLPVILKSNRSPEALAQFLSPDTAEGQQRYANIKKAGPRALATDEGAQAAAFALLQKCAPEKAKPGLQGDEDGLRKAFYELLWPMMPRSIPQNARLMWEPLVTASLQGLMDLYAFDRQPGVGHPGTIHHLGGGYTPGLANPSTGALALMLNDQIPLEERYQRLELGVLATLAIQDVLGDAVQELEGRGPWDERAARFGKLMDGLGLDVDPQSLRGDGKDQDAVYRALRERLATSVDARLPGDQGRASILNQFAALMATAQDPQLTHLVLRTLLNERLSPPLTEEGQKFPFELKAYDDGQRHSLGIVPNGPPERRAQVLSILGQYVYQMSPEQQATLRGLK